jgi:hypothetical protein
VPPKQNGSVVSALPSRLRKAAVSAFRVANGSGGAGRAWWSLALAIVAACGVAAILIVGAAVPTTIPSTHVPTWAYDDWTTRDPCNGGGDGNVGAPVSLVDQWVTYAESNCGPESLTSKAINDCTHNGKTYCTPVAYLEANWNYNQNSDSQLDSCNLIAPTSKPESWWLHIPGTTQQNEIPSNRLRTTVNGGGNIFDQTTQAVRTWFQNFVRSCLPDYPALMMDDTGGSRSSLLLKSFGSYTSSAEIQTNQRLVSEHRAMAAAMTHAGGAPYLQIDNGLSANNQVATPFALLNNPPSVQGLIAENAPIDNGVITPDSHGNPNQDYYATLLDEMAYVDNAAADNLNNDDFIALLSRDRSGSQPSRLVQQATVMLGYNGSQVVDWANLETNSNDLAVWPEEGIVPANPVQSMGPPGDASGQSGCLAGDGVVCTRGGHLNLQVPGTPGVYVREFRDCYKQGTRFGSCAAIVNDTATAYAVQPKWLTQRYQWQMGLSGGDLQSGGTINVQSQPFTAGSTTIGPHSAMLLTGRSP